MGLWLLQRDRGRVQAGVAHLAAASVFGLLQLCAGQVQQIVGLAAVRAHAGGQAYADSDYPTSVCTAMWQALLAHAALHHLRQGPCVVMR